MDMILEKIKSIRKNKGFSHENMAHALNISQAAYSKIEKSETKLSVERLIEITEILETPVMDILDIDPNNIYHQNNNEKGTFIGHQEVQHLYQDNKEKTEKIEMLYEARLTDKDEMIATLQRIIDNKNELTP